MTAPKIPMINCGKWKTGKLEKNVRQTGYGDCIEGSSKSPVMASNSKLEIKGGIILKIQHIKPISISKRVDRVNLINFGKMNGKLK